MKAQAQNIPQIDAVYKAASVLNAVVSLTALEINDRLSQKYEASIALKREDLQVVRSYKIRGAYNKISSLDSGKLMRGVVCASAGNHAQGVAFSCNKLGVHATIFMPVPTPKQKLEQVRFFGGGFVDVMLVGDTFDDAKFAALEFSKGNDCVFIPPFDDPKIIEGQGTVGLEILHQTVNPIDYLFLPIGGGGLSAGVSTVFKQLSPDTKIIGIEPKGAPAMKLSIDKGEPITLESIDKFVDGAAVRRVGDLNFKICSENLDDVVLVEEGKICESILELYSRDAIVLEPAGALSIGALDQYADKIKGKQIVCILSGGNNDITRMEEIKEKALLYAGLKHYFIIRFPQRAGALKEFVGEVLGPNDDITHFEYTKKNTKEKGSAVVGIELHAKSDFEPLLERIKQKGFFGDYLNDKSYLLNLLV
jgi:threonine dehydratase